MDSNQILKKYFPKINDIANQNKQNNPYDTSCIQHYLWNEFCDKNIPFLIVLSNYIEQQFQSKNIDTILFTTRDCVFLKQLFNKLYSNIKSETFYASRALYLFPPTEYVEYCNNILTDNSLVIDFQGTGQSFTTLTFRIKTKPWYLLVNWNSRDKPPYSQQYLHDYPKKIIIREKSFFDDAIEKLNVDLVGTYFDFKNNKPISYEYEYDSNVIESMHKCFESFIHNLSCDDDIDKIKQYSWNNHFNTWMDKYYTNSGLINSMKWVHTHFQYTKDNIDKIRERYADAKAC